MEVWKVCKECSNYEVSSYGNVRGKNKRLLKPWIINSGYYVISLLINSKKTNYLIHRLVANNFLTTNSLSVVNHIDGNKLNNKIENLEWTTTQINNILGNRKNKTGQKYIYKTTNNKYFLHIIRNKKHLFGKIFETLEEAIQARDDFIKLENETLTILGLRTAKGENDV